MVEMTPLGRLPPSLVDRTLEGAGWEVSTEEAWVDEVVKEVA